MRKFSLLLLASGALSLSTFAQNDETYTDNYSTWSIGLDLGVNHFYGDLSGFYPESNIDGHNLGFGISGYGNYWFNHLLGASASAGYNSFTGKNVNTYFTSNELNFNIDVMFNISSLIRKDVEKSKWSFIPYVGYGISSSLPEVFDGSDNVVLGRNDRHNEAMFRGGLLVKYQLTPSLDLDLRYMGNYMLITDWADNVVSGTANDGHNHFRIGITYNFGADENKPSIVYSRPVDDMANTIADVEEKVNALTMDSDGDGVSDAMDKDNETPEGYIVDGSGVAMDTDRDGVADDIDQDPFTPRGAQVDATGREMDDDGDGVPNSQDMEPNTEEGALVNFQGKEIKTGMGGDMANAFLPDVFFNFNSATVTKANEQRLLTIAKIMMANEDVKFEVVGNTDPVGSEKYNLNLSERRAQAVVDVLVNTYGISADRFKVTGNGENSQVGNDNSINRRVEFRLMD